jgi:putative FmdB family regulatory protein
MPTYDYQCRACSHQFSSFHKISDPTPECPQCGSEVRKLLSAPAVHGASGKKEASSAPMHGCAAGACGCKYQVS